VDEKGDYAGTANLTCKLDDRSIMEARMDGYRTNQVLDEDT
jgi:hypothetical protein